MKKGYVGYIKDINGSMSHFVGIYRSYNRAYSDTKQTFVLKKPPLPSNQDWMWHSYAVRQIDIDTKK